LRAITILARQRKSLLHLSANGQIKIDYR
jgi:hypothetical protein